MILLIYGTKASHKACSFSVTCMIYLPNTFSRVEPIQILEVMYRCKMQLIFLWKYSPLREVLNSLPRQKINVEKLNCQNVRPCLKVYLKSDQSLTGESLINHIVCFSRSDYFSMIYTLMGRTRFPNIYMAIMLYIVSRCSNQILWYLKGGVAVR